MNNTTNIDVRGPDDKLLSSFPHSGEPSKEEIQKIKERFAKSNDLDPDDITVGSSAHLNVDLELDEEVSILSIFNQNGDFIMQNFTTEGSVTDELVEKYGKEYGQGTTLKISKITEPYMEKVDDTEE
jgi:hypothetical protein